MKAVLWMKSSCTTCRNAKARLAERGLDMEIGELLQKAAGSCRTPAPVAGGSHAHARAPKSPRYKELGLKDRRLTKAEAIELMVQDNNLLKRPILVHSKGVIIGFDPAAYAAL